MLPAAFVSLSYKFPLFPEMSVWDSVLEVGAEWEMHRMLFGCSQEETSVPLSENRERKRGENQHGCPRVCHHGPWTPSFPGCWSSCCLRDVCLAFSAFGLRCRRLSQTWCSAHGPLKVHKCPHLFYKFMSEPMLNVDKEQHHSVFVSIPTPLIP